MLCAVSTSRRLVRTVIFDTNGAQAPLGPRLLLWLEVIITLEVLRVIVSSAVKHSQTQ